MQRLINRWWRLALAVGVAAALSGCATKIRNNVTAFHEWPAGLENKTYVFSRTDQQVNDLEYRNYENLLRAELARLAFDEQESAANARLRASMQYQSTVRDVHLIQPVVDPYYYPYYPWGWGGGPGFGPWRGPQGYYPPGVYYPGDWGPPIVQQQESRYQVYSRQLKVMITDATTGRHLYDVTVTSEDDLGPLPVAMPYMIKSAFKDFPGPSGVPRVVELEMKKPAR